MSDTPRARRPDEDVHVPLVVASLLLGVFGGFSLAVSLPLEVLAGSVDLSWVAHAQVHGHLQVVGFAGLFVLGMGLRLAPRFGRGSLALPSAVRPAFFLLVGGLLLRAVGQPLADHDLFAAVMVLGAGAELLGCIAFAVIFGGTLAPALRATQPHALLLFSASVWLVVQAVFGAWWLTELAVDGGVVLDATRSTALVTMQVFGVLLSAILGVGMRSFPTFFGMPAPHRGLGLGVWALLAAGVALWAATLVSAATVDVVTSRLAGLGASMVGVAILGAVVTFGLGRWRHRMAPSSRGFIWGLQPVLIWLAVVGLGLAWLGGRAVVEGIAPAGVGLDALRHMFALGVVTLAIVTMAQLMLPEFASERITHPAAAWRGAAFGVVLSVAAVLRGVVGWAGIGDGDDRAWAMALAGILAQVAVAVFGLLYWRARRRHAAYLVRIAAMRARGAGIEVLHLPSR